MLLLLSWVNLFTVLTLVVRQRFVHFVEFFLDFVGSNATDMFVRVLRVAVVTGVDVVAFDELPRHLLHDSFGLQREMHLLVVQPMQNEVWLHCWVVGLHRGNEWNVSFGVDAGSEVEVQARRDTGAVVAVRMEVVNAVGRR